MLLLICDTHSWSEETAKKPLIGAQIWIEPGQSPEQIDGWFHQLAELHMPVARLFMMWCYLEPTRDRWDFSLYDQAFRSAEKYHVKIVATLTPSGPPPFLGGNDTQGGGIVGTEEGRKQAAQYLATVVDRYKTSPALDTWLLVNEPGESPKPQRLAIDQYRIWLGERYASIDSLNHSWGSDLKSFSDVDPSNAGYSWNKSGAIDWMTFWQVYQRKGLQWIADEVHSRDKTHPLHVNPPELISNLAGNSDDLPSWRSVVDTLGCSIHPAWHFGLLTKDRYALGVSYINDLVAGSIEPKRYWVTELQGGNNIYSGGVPQEPTSLQIAQWVWTSVGSGADRVIFWLLNARRAGVEAAEWSMLDLNQNPSIRLETASSIAKSLDAHQDFFAGSERVESPITVILSLETMTFEENFFDADYPGRGKNAHVLEALGFYEALSRIGPPPRIKHFDDYDWKVKTPERRTVILPDVRAMSKPQFDDLKVFVSNGNTLLISGLSGFYDPQAKAWSYAGFPLAEITGGKLKEVHFLGDRITISLDSPEVSLPTHLWVSSIERGSAVSIGKSHDEVVATGRTNAKGGRVLWIPSPIGLGAWLTDSEPLASYLRTALAPAIEAEPFTFTENYKGCVMRVLRNGNAYVTIMTNGGSSRSSCSVRYPEKLKAFAVWGKAAKEAGANAEFSLEPDETSVALWK